MLLNGTVRASKANQLGLLGFGGDKKDRYAPQFEGSIAVFLQDNLAVGADTEVSRITSAYSRKDDFKDVFIAWLPHKYIALTFAHVDLGNVADKPDQKGPYISLRALLIQAQGKRPGAVPSNFVSDSFHASEPLL